MEKKTLKKLNVVQSLKSALANNAEEQAESANAVAGSASDTSSEHPGAKQSASDSDSDYNSDFSDLDDDDQEHVQGTGSDMHVSDSD